MKTNELRIGNLISNNKGEIIKVTGQVIYEGVSGWAKPIILTETLLENNGIFDDGMRNFIIPDCKYFLIEWEQMNSCKYVLGMNSEYGNNEIISEPFTSVHELQNLLFSLNRTEWSLA